MWPILFLAAGVYGLSFLSQGIGASKLMVNQSSYGFDVKSGVILINMQFTNPSGQEFKVNYIFLDILKGTTLLGQIRQQNLEETFIIRPYSDQQYIIRVKPNFTSLALSFYKGLIGGKSAKLPDLTVKGNIRANNITIPYNQIISFS